MTSLHQLEKEARERRAQFNATLSDVHSRLTPAGLAKEVLLHTDPHLTKLSPAFMAVKRHPVVAAAAIAGASWLLRQAIAAACTPHLQKWAKCARSSSYFPRKLQNLKQGDHP